MYLCYKNINNFNSEVIIKHFYVLGVWVMNETVLQGTHGLMTLIIKNGPEAY